MNCFALAFSSNYESLMRALYLFICMLVLAAAGLGAALAQEVDYRVDISASGTDGLAKRLRENSLLVSLKDKKPSTVAALRRRASGDAENFHSLLQELGYFDARVDYRLVSGEDGTDVLFTIEPGHQYTLSGFRLAWIGGEPEIPALDTAEKPVGETVSADAILKAGQDRLDVLMRHGYPFPEIVERRLVVDHDDRTANVELTIDKGPFARFGDTKIEGFRRVDPEFIERRIEWVEGEPFDIRKVNLTRRNLTRSGVIAMADIVYGAVGDDGRLPVSVTVRESKHRSIGGGVAYSTTLGPVAQVFWEHRNLFGEAEKFRARLEVGTRRYGVTADFNKPDVLGSRKLGLEVSAELSHEELEAFNRDLAAISTLLHYEWTDTTVMSGGVLLEQTTIEEKGEDADDFTIAGLPLQIRFDNTDDLLDPSQGFRINAGVVPYTVLNRSVDFIEADFGVRHYLPLGERFVWANRARGAALFGASRSDIPASKRLFAGGGGSVRGYGYQTIGPLDEENDPSGGRLLVELGTEMRFMVTDSIELAAFYEGARVTRDLEAASDEDFRWGTGLGARYHTAIGPVRLDIAVPLDRRDEIDDAYQFYVSLGQAF